MNRVLVVEDEQHLAEGLRFNLEAEGYQVEVVESGEAALELLAREPAFDVVVLDIMLPGKDGFTVVSELRQAGQFVPTLILTARGQPEDVLRGFSAGADDYLTKPFELPILIARIRGLLRRREWLRASEPGGTFAFDGKSVNFNLLELRAGGRVWIVGGLLVPPAGQPAPHLPPAPHGPWGWQSGPYINGWLMQLGALLQAHAHTIREIALPPTGPVNAFENAPLLVAEGWH